MANYDPIEYILLIPKIVEISMFIFLAVKIYRSKDYILNKIYSYAFLTWTLYTLSDIVMWTNGANSLTWLFIANRFRDLQVIAATIFAFLMYFSTRIIIVGYQGLNKKKVIFIFMIFLIIAVLLAVTDKLDVYDGNGNLLPSNQWETAPLVVVSPNIGLLTAILMMFPLSLYVVSVVSLIKLVKTKIDDPELKRRMNYLIIGITLIPTGVIYFAIVLGVPNFYNAITGVFGRIIWIIAPVFIWLSQRQKSK
ncbi:MAG: hypothetical protein ACTSWX_12560 [Promethearchaeota archaeon]